MHSLLYMQSQSPSRYVTEWKVGKNSQSSCFNVQCNAKKDQGLSESIEKRAKNCAEVGRLKGDRNIAEWLMKLGQPQQSKWINKSSCRQKQATFFSFSPSLFFSSQRNLWKGRGSSVEMRLCNRIHSFNWNALNFHLYQKSTPFDHKQICDSDWICSYIWWGETYYIASTRTVRDKWMWVQCSPQCFCVQRKRCMVWWCHNRQKTQSMAPD